MTMPMLLRFAATKEIRALFPVWMACVLAIVAVRLIGDPRFYVLGLLTSAFGALALGALSLGHEYSHRTLALFLTQPARRARLLAVKLAVLTPMLLALTTVAWLAVLTPLQVHSATGARFWDGDWPQMTVLLLPILCGLFVAPLLTMLCRSPLAGMVFAIMVPVLVGLTAQLLAVAAYGSAAAVVEASRSFAVAVFWWGMAGVCTVAAALNWLMFRRLEAIDGPDQDLQLPPRWSLSRAPATSGSARRHPVWLLAKKELGIQQMAFVVAGLYLVCWVTLSFLRYVAPALAGPPLGAMAVLYSALLALLVGSLGSAEERQYGTIEWQTLLPMASWQQWVVKATTAIFLAVLLGIAWPALLAYLHPSPDDIRPNGWFAGAVIALTASSLYVSSLSPSGVKALLLSIPAIWLVVAVLGFLTAQIDRALYMSSGRPIAAATGSAAYLALWLAAGFFALVLYFGMLNHRSSERGFARAWPQAIWMFGYLLAGFSVVSIVLAFG